jgi:chemotaxis protein MotB
MTAAPGEVTAETVAASAALEAEIAKSVRETMAAEAAPEISVKATAEGVLINLTDDAAFSMFSVGSAIPDPKVVVLMEKIARALADEKGDVIVRGYTDGRPFHSDAYDNWRLSAARAHMAYYMLMRGGLTEQRVIAIEGHADRNLKNAADPYAAENRRIEILLKERAP